MYDNMSTYDSHGDYSGTVKRKPVVGILAHLEQRKVWTDGTGSVWRVKDMETRHIENTILHLEKHAPLIKMRYSICKQAQAKDSEEAGRIGHLFLETDSLEWINDFPLMQKLRSVLFDRYVDDALAAANSAFSW